MKKFKRFILSPLVAIVTMVAMTGASTNSLWLLHEPDMPESLKKDL